MAGGSPNSNSQLKPMLKTPNSNSVLLNPEEILHMTNQAEPRIFLSGAIYLIPACLEACGIPGQLSDDGDD